MTGQSVVKHFLTEGDKFLVSRLSPLEDQGGYAIASNYGTFNFPLITTSSRRGMPPSRKSRRKLTFAWRSSGSLVARIVFQPIEETSRFYFSKSLSSSSPKQIGEGGDSNESARKASLDNASKILSSLLLLFTHLLLLLMAFGPPYLSIATALLLPPRFQNTSAPSILRSYVLYIPMMAFNGVLEAFFASTSTRRN
jgi:oligosaccharide translocation protein RFT1